MKGHQDRERSYDQLDCWGKASVQADRLATEHMAGVRHQEPPTSAQIQDKGWTVLANNKLMVSNFESTIVSHCTLQTAKE